MKRRFSAACLLLLGLATAQPARAQIPIESDPAPAWVGEFAALSGNAVIGGLTAGVARVIDGGSFSDAFSRGFAAGTLVYAGKRVAVERFAGAGLIGREIAAAGSSIVANVARGEPALSRIVLPAGPFRVYVERGDGLRIRPRLDLVTTAAVIYFATVPELEFDGGRTLTAGAPVFRAPGLVIDTDVRDDRNRADVLGLTRAGAIVMSDIGGVDVSQSFAHERVHLIQLDQIFQLWTDPAEDWLLARLPAGARLSKYVDVNASQLVTSGLRGLFDSHDSRPWEIEANFLMDR